MNKLTFQATKNGTKKQHIEHCFIHRFTVLADNMPLSIKLPNGLTYKVTYERFEWLEPESVNEVIEVIGSFQKWTDGNFYAVVRPFQETKEAELAINSRSLYSLETFKDNCND